MKKLHKCLPSELAQMVFIDKDFETDEIERFVTNSDDKKSIVTKLNGTDYDLFLWLIYHTHKQYNHDGSTSFEFTYSDVKNILSNMDTTAIKKSLKKINDIQILSNYLQSYGAKEVLLVKPFEIEIIESDKIINDKNISYGFTVTTSKEFIQWFNNPTPNVDVNYKIIYNLNRMAKLLYVLLRDAYGGYHNAKNRYRNIDIKRLRHLMNVYNPKVSNSSFMVEIKKAIKEINEYSDLTISNPTSKKKKDIHKGTSEILSIHFTIVWDKNKNYTKSKKTKDKNTSDKPGKEPQIKSADSLSPKQTLEDYINTRVEKEFEKSKHGGIKNIGAYKGKIKKDLIANGINFEYELVSRLNDEKEKLKASVPNDGQPYMIVFKDDTNPHNNFYINNEYKFVNSSLVETVTNSAEESLIFIDDYEFELYFDKQMCDESDKFRVSRFVIA